MTVATASPRSPRSFAGILAGVRSEPAAVTRRIAARLAEGDSDVLTRAQPGMVVHCASGMLWITHDGDPRDVILREGECHHVDCDRPMRLHALQDCGFELEMTAPGSRA